MQGKYKKAKLYTCLLRGDVAHIGKNSLVHPPFCSGNIKNVYIGDNVNIFGGGWIETIAEYAQDKFKSELKIGDGSYIGHRCHIIIS